MKDRHTVTQKRKYVHSATLLYCGALDCKGRVRFGQTSAFESHSWNVPSRLQEKAATRRCDPFALSASIPLNFCLPRTTPSRSRRLIVFSGTHHHRRAPLPLPLPSSPPPHLLLPPSVSSGATVVGEQSHAAGIRDKGRHLLSSHARSLLSQPATRAQTQTALFLPASPFLFLSHVHTPLLCLSIAPSLPGFLCVLLLSYRLLASCVRALRETTPDRYRVLLHACISAFCLFLFACFWFGFGCCPQLRDDTYRY